MARSGRKPARGPYPRRGRVRLPPRVTNTNEEIRDASATNRIPTRPLQQDETESITRAEARLDMGNDRKHLVTRFAAAGLKLVLAGEPMEQSNPEIFQLDIPRRLKGNTRTEWFRIWPGHEDNTIVVLTIDKARQQLVLLVKEEQRTFTRTEIFPYRRWRMVNRPKVGEQWQGLEVVAIRDVGNGWAVDRRGETPSSKRHYLCGVDERQLFVCQLPRGCGSVDDAHRALKRTELVLAEGQAPGRTVRQGEWFFVNLTYEERTRLERILAERPYLIRKRQPIGAGGHPHRADEIVRIPGQVLEHGWPIRENDVFVRGTVQHVDHAPVRFAVWRKVIRNNEVGGAAAPTTRNGVFWVD
jgi:hypothetical protein